MDRSWISVTVPVVGAVVLDDQLTGGVDLPRISLDSKALEHGVVAAHVVGCGADGVLGFGVPYDNVGIAAGRDRAVYSGRHAGQH